jgi:flagellar biogenesis protein FliO
MWNKKTIKQIFAKIDNKWLLVGIAFVVLVVFGFSYFGNMNNRNSQNNMNPAQTGQTAAETAENDLIQAINAELEGESASGQPSVMQPKTYSFWYYFLRIMISLAVIVILIYVTVTILRFLTKNKADTQSNIENKGFIKKIESFHVSNHKSVHLLNVAGKYLLVGTADKDINLIAELSTEQVNEYKVLNNVSETSIQTKANFKEVFFDVFKKGNLK